MSDYYINLKSFITAKDAQQRYQAACDIEREILVACGERESLREDLGEFTYQDNKIFADHFHSQWLAKSAPGSCPDGDDCPYGVKGGACASPNRQPSCEHCQRSCPCTQCETGLDELIKRISLSPGVNIKNSRNGTVITLSIKALREHIGGVIRQLMGQLPNELLRGSFDKGKDAGKFEGYRLALNDIYNGGQQ